MILRSKYGLFIILSLILISSSALQKAKANNSIGGFEETKYTLTNTHDTLYAYLFNLLQSSSDAIESRNYKSAEKILSEFDKYAASIQINNEMESTYYILKLKFFLFTNKTDEFDKFIKLHKKPINELPASIEIAEIYHLIGVYYMNINDLTNALYYQNKCLQFDNTYHQTPELAKKHLYNLLLSHMKLTNYDSVIYYSRIAMQNGSDSTQYNMLDAYIYRQQGIAYKALGKYEQALEAFKHAQTLIQEQHANNAELIFLINSMGNLYFRLSDIDKAQIYYEQALLLQKEAEIDLDIKDKISVYNNLGSIALAQHNGYLAKTYFHLALSLISKGNVAYFESTVRANLAKAYVLTGQTDSAYFYFDAAIFREQLKDANWLQACSAYLNFLNSVKDFNKGAQILTWTQEQLVHSNIEDPVIIARYYLASAKHFYLRGDFSNSLKNIQWALNHILMEPQQGFYEKTDHPELNFSSIDLSSILYLKALILYQLNAAQFDIDQAQLALDLIGLSSKISSEIREEITADQSKIILNNNRTSINELAIRLCYLIYQNTNNFSYIHLLFAYTEKSKAMALADAIRAYNNEQFDQSNDPDIRYEHELRRDIARQQHQLSEAIRDHNEKAVSSCRKNIFDLNNSLDSLINSYKSSKPDYYASRFNSRVVNVHDIQNALRPDQCLLSYTLVNQQLYLFVITKDKLQLRHSRLNDNFNKNKDSLLSALHHPHLYASASKNIENYIYFANAVYRTLFKNIMDEVKGLDLIIIPDQQLSLIPFEALVVSNETKKSFKDLDYLIRHFNISYSNSATLYSKSIKDHNKRLVNRVLAVRPDYGNKFKDLYPDSLQNVLTPLFAARKEVDLIKKIVRTRTLDEKQANMHNYYNSLPGYQIIHLAMHTLEDPQNALNSALIFHPELQTPNSAFLHAFEIYNHPLNNQLTVLSSCNTGSGSVQKGEGVISLARAFLYAGSKSVIMSLWPLEDASNAQIISYFYQNLKSGANKNEALCQAKIRFLDKAFASNAHPFYWASTTLTGNERAVYIKPLFYWVFSFAFMAVIIIFILLLKKKPAGNRIRSGL